MVTAAWVLVGIVVLAFLYRIVLWYAIKYDDAHDVSIEPVKVYDAPKWLEARENPVEGGATGIVPGGVSYLVEPRAGGALIPKGDNRFGRHRKWRQ